MDEDDPDFWPSSLPKAPSAPPELPGGKPPAFLAQGRGKIWVAFGSGVAVGVALCVVLYLLMSHPLFWRSRRAPGQEQTETPAIERGGLAISNDDAPPGAILRLLPLTVEERPDDQSLKHLFLHIPIKAPPDIHIDVRELVLHILFYDIVDGREVVQTSANVNFHWAKPPADWIKSDTEELAVEYQLPKPKAGTGKRENRKYFGYIVRIYYRGKLQAAAAEPVRLRQQYPPPLTLPK